MKKYDAGGFTPQETADLAALAALPDGEIDTGDIPATAGGSGALPRGFFYSRPRKQQLTLRLDALVVEWFRQNAPGPGGRGYQTAINQALRSHIARASQAAETAETAQAAGSAPEKRRKTGA